VLATYKQLGRTADVSDLENSIATLDNP